MKRKLFCMLVMTLAFISVNALGKGPSQKQASQNASLLSVEQYAKLSADQQLKYINGIRQAVTELEQSFVQLNFGYAQNTQNPLIAIAMAANTKANTPAGWGNKCAIGGWVIDTVNGKCPTTKNKCDVKDAKGKLRTNDGFKCHALYNNMCIARKPPETISKRCMDAANTKPITPEQYADLVKNGHIQKITDVCKEEVAGQNAQKFCKVFTDTINNVNQEYFVQSNDASTIPTSSISTDTTATSDSNVCVECDDYTKDSPTNNDVCCRYVLSTGIFEDIMTVFRKKHMAICCKVSPDTHCDQEINKEAFQKNIESHLKIRFTKEADKQNYNKWNYTMPQKVKCPIAQDNPKPPQPVPQSEPPPTTAI